MKRENTIRQAYRLYGIGIIVWAISSLGWIGFGLNLSPSAIGSGWLLIAAVGAILAVGMATVEFSSEYRLFKTQTNRQRIQRFRGHMLSSTPLHLYIIALSAWSFLTVEWWVINLGLVGRTIVAYGWFIIALYGLGLTIGLTVKHDEAVLEAAENVTPDTVGLQSD